MAHHEYVYGLHSVQALIKTSAHRVQILFVSASRKDQKVQRILEQASKQQIAIEFVDKKHLDERCDGNHQGLLAQVAAGKSLQESDLYPLVDKAGQESLVLVLDGVTDPHNLGACLRSADAAGVTAVVIPKDNSAGLNETARKVASGAAEAVPLIAVTNLARCLGKLKDMGVWVTGLAGEADELAYEADLRGARAIVMGAEGKGLRRLTRESCDGLVRLPMLGVVSSLNVSVATGVVLFEVVRQRRTR